MEEGDFIIMLSLLHLANKNNKGVGTIQYCSMLEGTTLNLHGFRPLSDLELSLQIMRYGQVYIHTSRRVAACGLGK